MEKENDKQLWNTLGKVIAVLITIAYVVFITNNIWHYVPASSVWEKIVSYSMYYGPLALVLVVTFEAVADKNVLIRVLFLLMWVAIILFSVSPTLWGLIPV